MNQTDNLIRRLAAGCVGTASLPSPQRRMLSWFAASIPYVALVVLVMSPRPDLFDKVMDTRFVIEQSGALLTALTAAMAAFCATIPGLPTWRLLLPLAPLALWVGSLGQGCLSALFERGTAALKLMPDLICFPAILMVSLLPAILMITMLRRGAPLMPKITVAYGALAATALGNFGLRLFHPQDASLMVLVWQFGTVVILTAFASLFGRRLLRWRHVAAT
ncbi:MAG: DUF1109 family protein [Alphaproteobacteria bacterium]|nr:DUF1109 family protein [Alphaproteobacteria bacterium]